MSKLHIDTDQELVVEWFEVFDTENNLTATVLLCKSGNGFRYNVIPAASQCSGWDRKKDSARKRAMDAVREKFKFSTNVQAVCDAMGEALKLVNR